MNVSGKIHEVDDATGNILIEMGAATLEQLSDEQPSDEQLSEEQLSEEQLSDEQLSEEQPAPTVKAKK
jgi:hypothetical protein